MLEDSIERVKLTDFGLACVAIERSDLTSLGNVVGTPAYMSPEQVEGRQLDARSDLFSIGCVMYAMVAGKSPFRASNAIAAARNVMSEPHVPLTEIADDLPDYLVEIVDRLLQKEPADRFRSAAVNCPVSSPTTWRTRIVSWERLGKQRSRCGNDSGGHIATG